MSKRPSTADRDRSAPEDGNEDAFLSRWARRKRIARGGGDPDAPQVEPPAAHGPTGTMAPADGEDEGPGDEDMPPLESIDENTDMSGFFSPKVSQGFKRAALRKFFHSPVFNVVDGLDDYDDDFRSFAALGDIVTSDMRGLMERQAEQAKDALAQEAESAPPSEGSADGEAEGVDATAAGEQVPEAGTSPAAGVTREPGERARHAPGKLRPRKPGGESA